MKLRMTILTLWISSALYCLAFAQAQKEVCHTLDRTKASTKPAELMDGYGKVEMTITTKSEEARKFFNQGLALLHSFWFYEADRSFERAAQLDPECAMAQWGIAMAAINDTRRDAAIARAKELAAKVSDREKLYLAAVEARYQGEKSTVQNNGFLGASEPYQKMMRKIVALYPADLEAKLFLALSLMAGYERDGTPKPGTVESIALLEVVLSKSPRHLAAHHYLIHATESGTRAIDGVPAADIYGSLAPKVGHAVHMPGHIYVHVDRWDDAARAFETSAEVDRAYIRDNHEESDHAAGPYGHNLHFLITVYNYQGRYRDSLRASQEILDVGAKPGEEKSRTGLEARMARLRTLVRFEKWDELLDGKTLPAEGNYEVFKAWRYYASALAQLGKGHVDAARADLERLERETAWLKEKFGKAKDLPQGGRQKQLLRALGVAPLEVQARLLAQSGNADDAIAKLREAIEEEYKLGYSEPPIYPNPMEEVAGKLCLALKRWTEAEEFFRAAIRRDPGSGRAYFGLMQSQRALSKSDEAEQNYRRFLKAWERADRELPEMIQSQKMAATDNSSGSQRR